MCSSDLEALVVRAAPLVDGNPHRRSRHGEELRLHLGCAKGRGQPVELQPVFRGVHRSRNVEAERKGEAALGLRLREPCAGVKKRQRRDEAEQHGESATLHQCPVFSMLAQGSAGALASPACRSSMDMLSGERTKAMRPSRGGRLMVTPLSIRFWQVA